MPFVFIRDYSEELLELNDNLHHVLIESVKKIGGEQESCALASRSQKPALDPVERLH